MPVPSPRGRLIFPFLCEIAQLDTAATAADPDGAGPLTSGYDPDFRSPVKVLAAPGDQVGADSRVETAVVTVRAQIEPQQFETLEMMLSGESPDSKMGLILHYKDLEAAGLVGVDGVPLIRKRDRLVRILTTAGVLVETIPNPPGLFVTQVQSRGFGHGTERNLLLLVLEERDQSIRGA